MHNGDNGKKIKSYTPTVVQTRDIRKAREEYKKGEYITLEQLERELGIMSKKTL